MTGLIGRASECARIDQLLDAARDGRSSALVVRGDAGVGKSALLAYAAERAADIQVQTVTGVEAEADLAFSGLHGLLLPMADPLPGLPEPQRRALSAALGLAAGEGSDRFLASAGVLSLLAANADERPLLCLVDDAQWIDTPSADALAFVARRLGAERVVLLFGAREGETRRFEAPGVEELVVPPLDRNAASVLLEKSAPQATAAVRARVLDEAAGNPLALLELPGALSDEQLLGQAALPGALPLTDRLRALFSARVESLGDATREALLVAAANDSDALTATLGAMARLELPSDALDAAHDLDLVRAGETTVAFRHPLVRSVVYESAALGRRRRAHAALAEALAAMGHADRALWHRAMAADAADEDVAAALEASGRESQARGGHASAATAYDRAADLTADPAARGVRLALAAEAAWAAGQTERAKALLERALPLAERRPRARLLYLRGTIEGQSGWLLDGVETLKEALALSDDRSLSIEILREGCSMANQAGDYAEAAALGLRAADIEPADDTDRFTVATVAALGAELAGDHERAAELASEAIEVAERLDDPRCLIWAAYGAARNSTLGAGLPHASRAVRLAREQALVTTLPFALQVQGAALIGQSRFDSARSAADEGWRLAVDVGQPWPAAWNLVNLAVVDALRGDEQLTLEHVAELQGLVAQSGAHSVGRHIGRILGLLHLGLGRPAEALERLLAMVTAAQPETNPLFLFGVPDAVEAAVRTDRVTDVADQLERFRSWIEGHPNAPRLALLARVEALLEGGDDRYAEALDRSTALSPFDQARTRLLYGEWLRRNRQRIEARRHLRSALDVFQQLAVPPWEARARAELRASGETARKRDATTRDQLTPQELQIARLVASGMSNPEVAAQLFLSPRTIDYHLRKVFAKLGIASRAQLATADLGEPIGG